MKDFRKNNNRSNNRPSFGGSNFGRPRQSSYSPYSGEFDPTKSSNPTNSYSSYRRDDRGPRTERSFGGGERREFGGEKREFSGERKDFGGERREFKPRRTFGSERSFGGGERREFGGEKENSTAKEKTSVAKEENLNQEETLEEVISKVETKTLVKKEAVLGAVSEIEDLETPVGVEDSEILAAV